MATPTVLAIEHIVITPGILGGRPHIAGHRLGVHFVVSLHLEDGLSVGEIARRYDLTQGQVHAALAYYFDHQAEIDALLDEEKRLNDTPDDPQTAALRARVFERLKARLETEPDREMTASEIAGLFGLTTRAVRDAAIRGKIAARKSGSTWLIRYSDARKRWGSQG